MEIFCFAQFGSKSDNASKACGLKGGVKFQENILYGNLLEKQRLMNSNVNLHDKVNSQEKQIKCL